MAALALVGALVLARVEGAHQHRRFGLANGITLARAGGAAVLAAFALDPAPLAGTAAGWAAFGGAALLLGLDGIDGAIARGQRLASAFGARFDLEVDAGMVLTLSALALALGKAGPWVLGLGLLRYAFVLAGRALPALARPLAPSRRRSAVCALAVAALTLVLAPPVAPPLSAAVAAAAGAALVASFAVDVARLLGRPAR